MYLLFLVALAFAHESGHGPAIPGKGAHGGKLSAVISAKEAELGARAKAVAVAELVRKGNVLTIHFRDARVSKGDLKWILLGSQKPQVIVQNLSAEKKELQKTFSEQELQGVKTFEVILPGLNQSTDKHVVSFSL